MKKSCLLSGMIVVSVIVNIDARVKYPRESTTEQTQDRTQMEQVEYRPSTYKMIDDFIKEKKECIGEATVNWPEIFRILDSMNGSISINEYSTYAFQYPLLWVAVKEGNLLIAKILLAKYKASPNSLVYMPNLDGEMSESMFPLMFACKTGNIAMIDLLLKYGANPNIKNEEEKNSFDYALNSEVLKNLNKFKK